MKPNKRVNPTAGAFRSRRNAAPRSPAAGYAQRYLYTVKVWKRVVLATPLVAALVLAVGCMDQDPFGLATRRIVGDYQLERWEDGKTFYLQDDKREYDAFPDLGGPIGGTVLEIGWNKRYIAAKRRRHIGGVVDGWMIVDSHARRVEGPYTRDTLATDPRLVGIEILSAKDAWDQLRRW